LFCFSVTCGSVGLHSNSTCDISSCVCDENSGIEVRRQRSRMLARRSVPFEWFPLSFAWMPAGEEDEDEDDEDDDDDEEEEDEDDDDTDDDDDDDAWLPRRRA
jgi:hypothetical protein